MTDRIMTTIGGELLPDQLYKYYSLDSEYTFQIFEADEVFFNNPKQHFNDPFDCRLPYDMSGTLVQWERKLKQIAKQQGIRLKNKELRRDALNAFRRFKNPEFSISVSDEILHDVGVFCLSEVSDDILMFSHYANSHRGMCVGFRCNDTEFSHFYFEKKSRYTSRINYIELYQPPNFFAGSDDEKVHWALFTKSNRWNYEKEWRIINRTGYGNQKYPRDMLLEVSLGCLVSEENRERILDILRKRTRAVRVYQYKRSSNAFQLYREQIA